MVERRRPDRFYDLLRQHVGARADQECAVDATCRLTWGELDAQADVWAKALLAAGVRRGDRIAVMIPPSVLFWITLLAASSVGAVWVGLNPRYRRYEFEHTLTDSQPRLVLTVSPFEGRDYAEELRALRPDTVDLGPLDASNHQSRRDFLAAGEGVSTQILADARAATLSADAAVIVYTSGMTGRPKGARLSQGAMIWAAGANVDYFGAEAFSCGLCPIPVNHVGALDNVCLPNFYVGGKLVFHPRVETRELHRLAIAESVTHVASSPTMFSMALDDPAHNFFSAPSLELVVYGGAPTPEPLLAAIRETSRAWFSGIFGQTETCGMITATPRHADVKLASETFGWPFDGIELRIVGPDGADLPDGETGELLVRGPVLMEGYHGLEAATRETIDPAGWLRTGDLCERRPDGAYVFRGRLKEMFKSGGYNIYPPEIEAALLDHPAVGLAAVVPAPDPRFHEVGWAFVQPKAGAAVDSDTLAAFLRERLANYKAPKRIIVEQALPLLPNTKIDKQALRARVSATLSAEKTEN